MTATTYAAFHDKPLKEQQLDALTKAFDPFTQTSLAELGIQPGWRILDFGAGSGTISAWLADHVGDDGLVTATDIDPTRLPAHRRISPAKQDITVDPLPTAHYDLIHARLVLIHVPGREAVLPRLLAALKPGGVLVLHEFDCTAQRLVYRGEPDEVQLFAEVTQAVHAVLARAGVSLDWGIRLHTALQDAGFAGVTTRCQTDTFHGGPGQPWAALAAVNVRQLHEELLAGGLTAQQLEAFADLMASRGFVGTSYMMTRTVGRRPQ